ncbi:MAG: hypothetical protein ACRERC_14715 [Candidatus Binatia bacterium]
MSKVPIIIVAFLMMATVADAAVVINVSLGEDDEIDCAVKASEDGSATIHASVSKGEEALSNASEEVEELRFTVTPSGAGSPMPLTIGPDSGQFLRLTGGPGNAAAVAGARYSVRRGQGAAVICQQAKAAQGSEGCASIDDAMAQARSYLLSHPDLGAAPQGRTRPVVAEGWRTGRTFDLYHMPNGQAVSTLPADLTERDTIRLVVIAPANADVEWPSDGFSCANRPIYRLFHVPPAVEGEAQSGGADLIPEQPKPSLFWYPQDLRCADKLEYTVKVTLPGCQTAFEDKHTFKTRPVYDFSIGAGFGFDFGSPVEFSVQNRTGETEVERVIVRTTDRTGFKPVITLSYFPFGTDLDRFRWWEVPAPFIALDPTRIDQGAIAGLSWTFPPGFGIMTGVSVYQSQVISSPVGAQPGDVLPMGVNLGTRETFNSDSVGFFLGANFTTEIMAAFFKAAGGAFGAASGSGAAGAP